MAGIDTSSAALLVRALTNRAIQEQGKHDDVNRAIAQAPRIADALRQTQAREDEIAEAEKDRQFTTDRDASRRAEELADQQFTMQRDETRNEAIADRAVQADQRRQAAQQLDRRASWDAAFPGSVAAPEIGDTGPSLSPVAGTPLPQNAPPAPYDPYGIPNRPDHLPPQSAVDALVAQRQDEIAAFEAQQAATEEAQKAELERQQKAYIFRPSVGDNGEMGLPEFGVVGERAMQVYGYIPFEISNEFIALQSKHAKALKAQAGEEPAETPEARLERLENESAARARGTATGRADVALPPQGRTWTGAHSAWATQRRGQIQALEEQLSTPYLLEEGAEGPLRERLIELRDEYNAFLEPFIGTGPLSASEPDAPTSDIDEAQKRGFVQNPETGVWEKR